MVAPNVHLVLAPGNRRRAPDHPTSGKPLGNGCIASERLHWVLFEEHALDIAKQTDPADHAPNPAMGLWILVGPQGFEPWTNGLKGTTSGWSAARFASYARRNRGFEEGPRPDSEVAVNLR